jgi:hypothetical protein
MAAAKNPIQRRLTLVNDEWVEFAELPDARVLCLQVTPDEAPMFDAFVAVESEPSGQLPDLFIRLLAPFDSLTSYGFALSVEFCKQAEALHEGLESPETPPWAPPRPERGEADVALLVRSCSSFSQHYALPGHLALVLQPAAVSAPTAFQSWLQRLALAAPANVRAVVLDDAREPELTPLAKAEPVRVVAKPLDLDMPGARLEISQEAGGLDTPGGQFRHLFVKLANALGEGKLPEALGFGQAALAIAGAQSWFALAVPVHFALGAALAGVGRGPEANERYLLAEAAATRGEEAGDATCTKLRAQARMVRGGLLISQQQFPLAAQLFTDTLPVASAAQDPRMVLDCYRLASFAHEQNRAYDKAWQSGVDGLTYAKGLDAETRQTSSLAYLGEGLMRLTKQADYSSSSLRIEREMVALLGRTDWRPAPPATQGAAGATP